MKQQIKLTESELTAVINEAVRSILKEYDPHMAGLGVARGLEQGKIGPWNAAQKIMKRDKWDKSQLTDFQNGIERKPIQQNGQELEEYTNAEIAQGMRMYGRPSYDEDEFDDFNEQPANNAVGENKAQQKVTESQLHDIIKESVMQVLNEIDWRTIASAQERAAGESLDDKKPAGFRAKRKQQFDTFKQGVHPQMKKQYGLSNDEVADAIKGKGPFYDNASRRSMRQMDKLNADYERFRSADPQLQSKYKDGQWQ